MRISKKPIKKKKVVTQDLKTKFRRSKEWKKLREKIKSEQKLDPITQKPLSKTYNLHHGDLNPDHYTDISDETHFIGLNSTSHDLVHFVFGDSRNKKNWREIIARLVKICEWMESLNH
jgi:hypothetical protein